ncbi:hypothetical protein GCM10010112_44220 [Actinoplanes lobatus]|uniref:Lipoprotein n=1 Tax=Actinoplanes lobatus TaxID=113568 RepID=A0A7W7MF47_9ACTN|nr:hypothetical protein [Actinoplanes lobatus]MBB4747540.1 hypothetical protein [Actinoplanes lobatus]GGN74263.1 hypothetical protein GCM10010112_44220 [Actinoplanes lobatus]GIE39899.1 hypothetical protein Alo02nite_27970 [Actinoplanes lobatus]
MRRTVPFLGAVLGLTFAVTGCAAGPEQVGGVAAPVGAAVPTTAATSASPTTAASPSASKSSAPAKAAALVLGPDGLGALELGMTRAEALATGKVVKQSASTLAEWQEVNEGCVPEFRLKGSQSESGWVWYQGIDGLAAIPAPKGVATPEGIKVGSTLDDVRRAYPKAVDEQFLEDTGRVMAKAPGNRQTVYRIQIDGDSRKVTSLTLQLTFQECYE